MKEFFTSRFQTINDFLATQQFPGSDLKNIFSWEFWAESFISTSSPYYLAGVIVTIVIVGLLVWWQFRLKQHQKIAPIYGALINHLSNIIAFVIIIGLSYLFFRSQAILYVSSRLVILFTLLLVLFWSLWVGYIYWRVLPSKRLQHLEKERFFRYLPKKNKK